MKYSLERHKDLTSSLSPWKYEREKSEKCTIRIERVISAMIFSIEKITTRVRKSDRRSVHK